LKYFRGQNNYTVYKRIWCCHLANRFEIFGTLFFSKKWVKTH